MTSVWIILSALLLVTIVLSIIAMIKYQRNGGMTDYRALYLMGAIWMPLGIVFWTTQQNPAFFVMGGIFLFVGAMNKDKWNNTVEMSPVKKKIMYALVALTVLLVGFTVVARYMDNQSAGDSNTTGVTTFEECVAAGNPVMESYPRQCRHNNVLFVEGIGNELEQLENIRVSTPRPHGTIMSPLTITGEARGTWFFEASFPVLLTDWDGRIIAEHYATAQGAWMTEDFVPFTATLDFETPPYDMRGTLILQRSNPSGLPENDDALEIPVIFLDTRNIHYTFGTPQEPITTGEDAEKNVVTCEPSQRNVDACIQIYQPVCATVNVQCIKAPCPPIQETYGNSCEACSNSLVESYTEGECGNNDQSSISTAPAGGQDDQKSDKYRVEDVTGESCEVDEDCPLPPDYAIRSNCPYESRCIAKTCTVICPEF